MANTLTFNGQTLTDADIFGGISFTHDLNTGTEFSIGNTASASVTFVTDVQLPLYTKDQTNGTFTWNDGTARGRFYITEVTKAQGKYTVTAYDAMILADTNISALSLSFPLTVSALASAIATYLGCTVSGTINNGTISIDALDDTLSIRKVLGYVAEASGCSVKIDGSDHLCFMYYASSGITISASQYKESGLEVADYTCAAIDNVVILGIDGEPVGSYGSGTNTLYVQGNPILYEATNTEAQVIYTQVSGFAYAPVRCEMFEENGLEVGTIATFGSTASLVMHIESSEDGAVASSVGSDSRAELNKSLEVIANEAMATAQALNQHFWFTASGSEAGAHIAEVDKDTFEQSPSGSNLLAKSNGLAVRDGLEELARFGTDGMQVGKDDEQHITITQDTFTVSDEDGNSLFSATTTSSSKSATPTYKVMLAGSASVTSTMYLKGTVTDDRFYVNTGTSSYPTTFTQYVTVPYPTTSAVTITVAGVSYSFTRTSENAVTVTRQNTTTSTRYACYRFTQTYKEADVVVNGELLAPRYRGEVPYTSSNGVVKYLNAYTYGNVAMIQLAVYKTSSISANGVVFIGKLLDIIPSTGTSLSGIYYESGLGNFPIIGTVNSTGEITVINSSGKTITPTESSPLWLYATYIFQ